MRDPFHPEKNLLARSEEGLLKDYQRPSADLIHEVVTRAGGELEPFEVGTASLTERVVRLFKQFGFFGFEWLEKHRRPRNRRNKFTKYGSSQFKGEYPPELIEKIQHAIDERDRLRAEKDEGRTPSRWFW